MDHVDPPTSDWRRIAAIVEVEYLKNGTRKKVSIEVR